MTIDEKFPDTAYEMIKNDRDNPGTWARFNVSRGYWYSTNADMVAKEALEETFLNVPVGGYLKMVDPDSVPLRGVWYYWV